MVVAATFEGFGPKIRVTRSGVINQSEFDEKKKEMLRRYRYSQSG
jgi:hypothetical protein